MTKLSKKRQGVRLNVQKEIGKVDPMLVPEAEINPVQLEVTIEKLRAYMEHLKNLDEKILDDVDPEFEDQEIEKTSQFNDVVLEAVTKAAATLKFYLASEINHDSSDLKEISFTSKSQSVKLPKLEITAFSGEPLKWQEFWDSFDSTIHQHADLGPVEKFKYLKGFLNGDALRLVDGYRLTAANYDAVIAILEERYGNKQIAVFAHFEAMLSLPVSNHDISNLQSISDECEKHIRSLVALGLAEDTFGQVFMPIMLSKLPKFVKMELYRRNGSIPWTLTSLRELLKDEIRARELSSKCFTGQNDGKSEFPKENPNRVRTQQRTAPNRQTSTSSLVASSSAGTSKSPGYQCTFCGGSHYSDECKKYPDVYSRRGQLGNRCSICFRLNHSSKECKSTFPCYHCKRTGHNRTLCYTKFPAKSQNGQAKASTPSPRPTEGLNVDAEPFVPVTLVSHEHRTIMQTALATVVDESGHHEFRVRLFFDTGSSRSYITTGLKSKLGLPTKHEEIVALAAFQSTKRKTVVHKLVDFQVQCTDGSLQKVSANVVPTITCPIQKVPIDVRRYPVVQQILLAEPLCTSPEMIPIDILIGNDHYYNFVGSDQIRCDDGLVLLASKVGFITAGRISTDDSELEKCSDMLLTVSAEHSQPNSNFQLEKFWRLEDIGIKPDTGRNDDELAADMFNKSITFDKGRYHVMWPWKEHNPDLQDNYFLARKRLQSLWNRIHADLKVLDTYHKTIVDQEKAGIIEEAPETPSGHVYYMPHHCVLTPSKQTTKLRVVYDASSKGSRATSSLNECLHRGPSQMEDLCGLLIRFRLSKVAMTSDIEKAFLQIGLQESQRDCTRFLWVVDPTKPPTGNNLKVFRFCRVPFGVVSSPFMLLGTISFHLKKDNSATALDILANDYVDNVINGRKSTDDAFRYYLEAKSLFQSAGMNLREWYSNSAEFMEKINPTDRGQDLTPKVLGLIWDPEKDTIQCQKVKIAPRTNVTKRQVLCAIAKLFDPCGFFAPVSVTGKILMQELWEKKLGWDEELPNEILVRWEKLLCNYELISSREIARLVVNPNAHDESSIQIHCFCDASAKAYAAVIYLRSTASNVVYCNLTFAKSRVAPLKKLSIPRLELMAVVIGTRLIAFVAEQLRLPVSAKFLWSDSQCVLHWLQRRQVSTVFVDNRVKEIKSHSDVEFRYVPTEDNPADLPTRGCNFATLDQSSLWWYGPTWLKNSHEKWPITDLGTVATIEDDDMTVQQPCMALPSDVQQDTNPLLFEISKFSSAHRLLRVTAWILRFVGRAKKMHHTTSSCLQTSEIAAAKLLWERKVQEEYFPDLVKNTAIGSTKLGRQLGLYVDFRDIIRCRGRLQNSELPLEAIHPILIPKNCPFSDLLIKDCHCRLMHSGVAKVLSQLRYEYWIPQCRNQIKRVIRGCLKCRRITGGPFEVPSPPPLPEFRGNYQFPFSCTGLDYLGPLLIKTPSGDRQKVWVCLFTCAVTRAIHLEVVETMSTEDFLLCLRRFCAHYGVPSLIVSDNATQFHAANRTLDKLLKSLINSNEIQEFATYQGIQWKFITEGAPWMGGFYERLVGVVKDSLKKSLEFQCVRLCELQTVVAEVSAVVNSRPLVYAETEVSVPPLTPAHFLAKQARLGVPNFPNEEQDQDYDVHQSTGPVLILKWKRLQAMVNRFWQVWRDSYLISLRERYSLVKGQRNTSHIAPSLGSVVQIKEAMVPRAQWKIGIICAMLPSQDGKVRSVKVRLSNGKFLTRAIKVLYPIEMGTGPVAEAKPPDEVHARTKIHAAVKARSYIEQQLAEEDETLASA